MKIITGIFLVAYAFAWLATFWLPARKTNFTALAVIPTAVFAFGIPMLVSNTIRRTPHEFLMFWSLTPFLIVLIELVLIRHKKMKPNK
jgi:hypothetical protein